MDSAIERDKAIGGLCDKKTDESSDKNERVKVTVQLIALRAEL